MLVVDAANVVGSRPTGWWRDRAGAAAAFVEQVRASVAAGRLDAPVCIVLEGLARDGAAAGARDGIEVVHAPHSGDDVVVDVAASRDAAVVVTADRALADRVRALGADVVGPRWLLERLSG